MINTFYNINNYIYYKIDDNTIYNIEEYKKFASLLCLLL